LLSDPIHCIIHNGKKQVWVVKNLWELTKDFEVFDYSISTFDGFDEDCWFGDRNKPTIRKVMEHHEKIMKADYLYPIILSSDGTVMDGIHRICRAFIEGIKTIPAVKFVENPTPDRVEEIL